jgi:hypothetical protein
VDLVPHGRVEVWCNGEIGVMPDEGKGVALYIQHWNGDERRGSGNG